MAMHSSVTHTDPSAPTPQEPFPILASRHQLAEVPCVARIRKPDLAAPSFPSVHQEQGKWHLQELLQGTAGLTSGKVSGESASPGHSSTQRDHRGFWVQVPREEKSHRDAWKRLWRGGRDGGGMLPAPRCLPRSAGPVLTRDGRPH